MSENNPGGTPPPNPYGQPPTGENPYGQPAPPPAPYGQPPAGQAPYGQPPADNPYGQAPFGQQQPQGYYAQQPPGGPLGDGLDMYGRPLVREARPGTVTAAGGSR